MYWANFIVQQGDATGEWITIGSIAYSTTGLITGVAFLKAAALGVVALVSLVRLMILNSSIIFVYDNT